MSDFFELPTGPAEPEPQRYRMPPWFGPPSGTLPGIIAIERVLARTDEVAVCVTRLAAYPTGFEFDLVTMAADGDDELDPLLFEHHTLRHRGERDELPPELLRLGVQFSDGSKATNLGGFPSDSRQPIGPVMHAHGGGGGGGNWHQTHWVWSLPPTGPVAFVCEWPAMGIKLTRSELDAQPILDAAARAQVIFSDDHLPEFPDDDGPDERAVIL